MKRIIFTLLMIISIGANAQTVRVAAAANLRFVFSEIKKNYEEANPRTKIEVNFGSSGALVQQILNGADFDLYLAADDKHPGKLKEQGFVVGNVETYALGKLVLWSNTIDVSKGMDVLTSDKIKRIAIAKPELAPYGDRALQCLAKAKLLDKVKSKIVYADNISQTAQFVQTGNAEVGFLAMSLTFSPEMKGSIFILDKNSFEPIIQAMVLVKRARPNAEAAGFMNYILSDDAQSIFEDFGYFVPKTTVMN